MAQDFLEDYGKKFCILPWMHMATYTDGTALLCCLAQPTDDKRLNLNNADINAVWNSYYWKDARKEMLNNERPSECDYCWRIENQNPEHVSDRIYKSSYSWSLPQIPKIVESGRGEDFDPTYVEVAFDSTCNFKCIYCSPEASSRWEDEIRRHGDMKQSEFNLNNLDWLKSVGKLPIHHKENNPYKNAFWEWWPELYPTLETFRITGGEPLLSKDTWKVFDYIKENPNPDLIFALNTNCNAPDKLVDKMIENVKEIEGKVKYFDVYTSFENTGEHAEYTLSLIHI